jgi:hypothetical protein
MTVLTADNVLLSRLRGLYEPVEIRDPSGKVLGYYTPVVTPEDAEWYAKVKGLFDLEEAERIALAEWDQGRSLAECWEEIRSLEKQA